MRKYWHNISTFFEDGDLTPLAVLISVAHYGPVLVQHGENLFVAWAVGAMIDLLHFRSVRRAVTVHNWLNLLIGALTTVMAVGYHLRFYGGDWLLALPIPLGIAILAQHAASQQQEDANSLQETAVKAQTLAKEWQAKYEKAQGTIKDQQAIIKAWQSLNDEAQTLARYNAKMLTAEQAASKIGVKDVRTVKSRAEKLNGVAKGGE